MENKIDQLVELMYPFCAERMYCMTLNDYHFKRLNVPLTTNLITYLIKKEIVQLLEEKKDHIVHLILDKFDKDGYDIGLEILLRLSHCFRNDQEIHFMASEYEDIIECRKMINKFFFDLRAEGFFQTTIAS